MLLSFPASFGHILSWRRDKTFAKPSREMKTNKRSVMGQPFPLHGHSGRCTLGVWLHIRCCLGYKKHKRGAPIVFLDQALFFQSLHTRAHSLTHAHTRAHADADLWCTPADFDVHSCRAVGGLRCEPRRSGPATDLHFLTRGTSPHCTKILCAAVLA